MAFTPRYLGANSNHAHAASSWGVAVAAQKRSGWLGKAFKVELVADAVAWTRENNAVFSCNSLQVAVIIRVSEIVLQHVVVNKVRLSCVLTFGTPMASNSR